MTVAVTTGSPPSNASSTARAISAFKDGILCTPVLSIAVRAVCLTGY